MRARTTRIHICLSNLSPRVSDFKHLEEIFKATHIIRIVIHNNYSLVWSASDLQIKSHLCGFGEQIIELLVVDLIIVHLESKRGIVRLHLLINREKDIVDCSRDNSIHLLCAERNLTISFDDLVDDFVRSEHGKSLS